MQKTCVLCCARSCPTWPTVSGERARPLERELLLGDWRRRESDGLVEVPYRSSTDEQTVLVCILFEHLVHFDIEWNQTCMEQREG